MSKTLSELGINAPLQQALTDLKISVAIEIQEQVIPILLNQTEDLVTLSKTGTGKTAAFGLPLLQMAEVENENIQTLILAPTRELAQQIYMHLTEFVAYLPDVSMVLVTGVSSVRSQVEALKLPTQIVVATPGRLLDLLERNALDIKSVKHLVLDEADEMFQALREDLMPILKKRSE